ncbi:MAG: retropepsin-like aspartic protease [Desulfobacterales bacterium]
MRLKKLLFIAWLLALLLPCAARADGTYHVVQDADGMYFQTDRDGGWTIPRNNQRYFKVGEKGAYTRGTDADGTYIKIGERRKFYIDVNAASRTAGSASEAGRDRQPQSSARETPIAIMGNRVLVPATLGHGGREAQVTLVLDTGASITTLNREAVKRFQFGKTRKGKLIVADGNSIDADLVQFNYIKVGPHRVANLHAGIIDHKGFSGDYQGLLGMNFLRDMDYKIDFQRQVIIWR